MRTLGSYDRRVNYYETDAMGIVHHSNYMRFMEEARTELMRLNGADYTVLEKNGVLMPVIGISCRYKTPARYGDVVSVEVRLAEFNGIRAAYEYRMCLADSGAEVAVARSEHCFIDAGSRRPVNLKKRLPESYALFERLAGEDGV